METPNLDKCIAIVKEMEYTGDRAENELARLKMRLSELEAKYAQLVPGKH